MDDESSVAMEPMMDFWGVELSGKRKTVTWPSSEEDVEPDITLRLELRQACLGARAKTGERNVVELTTEDENGEEATHSIASLTVGGTEQSPLFLEVFPPVRFNLAAGSGPLHIVGNVHTEFEDLTTDDEEEEEEEEDEFSSHQIVKSRKRVADSPPGKLAKTRKIVKENGDGVAGSRQEEEEEREEEEEEEDDEEEEESDEEESEGEESDSEKEKETPQKPASVSKPKAKPVQKSTKLAVLSKTPQPPKGSKTSGKMSFSAPNTPQQTKTSKKGSKLAMNIEDMKEKLKKTPNLPKKLDKFNNYVQQNFKVNDDKVKKQLWEFAQKVRAAK